MFSLNHTSFPVELESADAVVLMNNAFKTILSIPIDHTFVNTF